jgi:hypothetical protein
MEFFISLKSFSLIFEKFELELSSSFVLLFMVFVVFVVFELVPFILFNSSSPIFSFIFSKLV